MAGDQLLAERESVQAQIDQAANVAAPDVALEALRLADVEIAEHQRKIDELVAKRNRVDERWSISQREAAERAAYSQDQAIRRTAEEVIATNGAILSDLDVAQDYLRGFIEAIVRARKRFPVAEAGAAQLDMAGSFSLRDFNDRLGQWIADELIRVWPHGGDRLGVYVSFQSPPGFWPGQPHPIPRWRDREMTAARVQHIEALDALIEERAHIR